MSSHAERTIKAPFKLDEQDECLGKQTVAEPDETWTKTGPWTDADLANLRELWASGLSTIRIGLLLHRSKNSVIGKVHRLDLPPRPSPLASDSPSRYKPTQPRKSRRSRKIPTPTATLPTLRSVPPQPKTEPTPRYVNQPMKLVAVIGPVGKCQFPTTDGRPWLFCDTPTVPGRSYCLDHCRICYRKPESLELAA